MVAPTATRVQNHTADHVNERIRQQTERNVQRFQHAGQADVRQRLEELDREWDVERTLETNFATVILVSTGLAALLGRKWLLLPAAAAAFMIQHALQGWCPPLPVIRRLGVRTAREIEHERDKLRNLPR